jgi:hypothetical protein
MSAEENPKLPDSVDYPPATFFEALRRHMAAHFPVYAISLLLFSQAFFTGFYDNFWPIEPDQWSRLGWWQKTAALFKSLSFSFGIVVGYLLKPHAVEKK